MFPSKGERCRPQERLWNAYGGVLLLTVFLALVIALSVSLLQPALQLWSSFVWKGPLEVSSAIPCSEKGWVQRFKVLWSCSEPCAAKFWVMPGLENFLSWCPFATSLPMTSTCCLCAPPRRAWIPLLHDTSLLCPGRNDHHAKFNSG